MNVQTLYPWYPTCCVLLKCITPAHFDGRSNAVSFEDFNHDWFLKIVTVNIREKLLCKNSVHKCQDLGYFSDIFHYLVHLLQTSFPFSSEIGKKKIDSHVLPHIWDVSSFIIAICEQCMETVTYYNTKNAIFTYKKVRIYCLS